MTAVLIGGYASVFGQRDGAGDRVVPGAFARSLRRKPFTRIPMLWQHDPASPVGQWDDIREDSRGLWVAGRLVPEVARAREAAALIGAGALSGLSIGFRAVRAQRNPRSRERILTEIDLWEISLVTFPQAEAARVRLLPHLPKTPKQTATTRRL